MKLITYTCALLVILILEVEGKLELDIFKTDVSSTIGKHHGRYIRSALTGLEGNYPWKNDSADIYKFMNGEYYGLIKVGSPAQQFRVMFDTTWSDVWLPSSHCAWTEIVCQLHNRYDGSKSSTHVENGTIINLNSSALSLGGILSTDNFHLQNIEIVNQTFLEATHISLNPFVKYKSDGIVGLAYKEQSGWPGVTPFFYNLMAQNLIEDYVFTFYMNRDATTDRAGKVLFGATARTKIVPDTLTKLEVVEPHKLWKVKVGGIFATKSKKEYPITGETYAVFDSAANTIVGPSELIKKLNYMLQAVYISGLDRYSVNCREYAKLPSVTFVMNGQNFEIQSKYYVQRVVVESIEACFSPFIENEDPTADYWELGGAFMMEFYTEFNMNEHAVYVAKTIF
ncbi:lysosomal aspartic protease-like [Trichogramma pretiosum]|uniref:lysosomal aspartic protease-like n=1 Tax=Trichogramma pretiosum TaxID=7493 RepID=UPI0006C9852D|nr:lysosomal aspartic protease-like [Trichogramma pretiosum]